MNCKEVFLRVIKRCVPSCPSFFLVASLVARLAIRLSGRLSAGLLVLGLCACLSTYLLAFLSASLHDFQPPAWPTA